MAHLLEVEDLHVWFETPGGPDVHAVRGVSFTLDQREKVGLVGESGCGKTTTLLAIAGLLAPSAKVSGRVLLDGQEILGLGERAMRPHRWTEMSMVFQGSMNAFSPVTTVGRQLADALQVRGGRSRAQARDRARELLSLVGIPPERASSYPHQLSGGMRQRATIALALSCEPKIVLADEPTTALDVMVQAQVMELLDRLCDELGLSLLLVSHDLMLVTEMCERLHVMYAGEIVETGSDDQIVNVPAHPYTSRLFAATADLSLSVAPVAIPGAPPRLDHPVTGCPFRPRCDRAFEPCAGEVPVLRPVRPGQTAACLLVGRDDTSEEDLPVAGASGATPGGRNGAA
jgi:oligopeptide/dipeptide ABC transporter ATP-binding protein